MSKDQITRVVVAERKVVGLKRTVRRLKAQNSELRRQSMYTQEDYKAERRQRQRWEARCRQLQGQSLTYPQQRALETMEKEERESGVGQAVRELEERLQDLRIQVPGRWI